MSRLIGRFIILSAVLSGVAFCFAQGGGTGELFQALQRENAELKKQAQDLRIELEKLRQETVSLQSRLVGLAAEKGALESRLASLRQAREAADERTAQADRATAQAAETLSQLRDLIRSQAEAVAAQKSVIAETTAEKKEWRSEAQAASAAAERAVSEAERAKAAEATARQLFVREEALGQYNIAVLKSAAGKYREAEKHFLACLKLLPDDADTHYNLGVLYEDRLRAPAKAVKHYRRFLELRPTGRDAEKVAQWLDKLEI